MRGTIRYPHEVWYDIQDGKNPMRYGVVQDTRRQTPHRVWYGTRHTTTTTTWGIVWYGMAIAPSP